MGAGGACGEAQTGRAPPIPLRPPRRLTRGRGRGGGGSRLRLAVKSGSGSSLERARARSTGRPPPLPRLRLSCWRTGTPEAPGVTEGMVGPTRLDCWPRTPRTVAGVLRAQSGGGRRLPAVERQRTSTLLCSDYKSTKRSVPRTPASSRSPECRRLRGGPRGLRAAPSRSPYPKAAL